MNNSKQELADPDDFFAETRMSFGEHIEDLRTHLFRAIKGFLIALFVSFFLAKHVLAFIRAPVERQLVAFWDRYDAARMAIVLENPPEKPPDVTMLKLRLERRMLTDALFLPKPDKDASHWVTLEVQFEDPKKITQLINDENRILRPPVLTVLSVTEGFAVWAKVAIMTGFVIGSPWIFYQLWMFVAAGLYPHEKKYVNVYLPFSIGLFLGGVLLCEFFVMDKAVEALLWFNEFLGLVPELRLSEWLGFAIFMPLVFGLSFQTPIVMLFIQRVGVVSTSAFRTHRRIVWFLMAVFAAVITPSTDPVSMLLLWVPMVLLYELGIYLCVLFPGTPLLDFDVPESEEMVEV